MRGTGGEDGRVILEHWDLGELPGRGGPGDRGVVGGLGDDLQVGDHGELPGGDGDGDHGTEGHGEQDGVVVTWSSHLHMANLRWYLLFS